MAENYSTIDHQTGQYDSHCSIKLKKTLQKGPNLIQILCKANGCKITLKYKALEAPFFSPLKQGTFAKEHLRTLSGDFLISFYNI